MSSFLSKIKPTEKSIQKEYVEKRKRALFANDSAKTEAVKKKIEVLHERYNVKADWHDTYLKIHRSLKASDLTINFDALSWFSQENNYGTYAQMYERATKDGKMTLKGDKLNPALSRAVVDDLVTIPDDWAQAHRFSQRRRLRDALHATGANRSATGSLANPGEALRPTMKGDETAGYTTTNKLFMPKAKQVFAALNYGRRDHGSTTEYGFSHLVLRPTLKDNAFYYAGDTFFGAGKGAAQQATLNTIGALLEKSSRMFDDELWPACYSGLRRADTSNGDFLLEAHIFKELKMAEDVQDLVLSRKPTGTAAPMSLDQWKTVIANATKWCKKNGVRLTFASS
jgi:hypothetical protein